MDKIWEEMYNAAKAVLKPVTISDYVSAGENHDGGWNYAGLSYC
ncbi:hypothetical protein [Butyrivibrio sp. WCE2006]|nr:hypothetical protein [Butyrivibrio sp. WCE2006]